MAPINTESNAGELVPRPALKTGFSEMGWGSTPLLSTNNMNEDYFIPVNTDINFLPKVKEFIPNAIWKWVPSMFIATNLSSTHIGDDQLLSKIHKEFLGELNLYKIPCKSVYGWHQDKNSIGCSLNMALDRYHCHTLFSVGNHGTPFLQKVIELEYDPNTWYAFNSKQVHTVINLDEKDRYLLSYVLPGIFSYTDLKSWLVQHTYTSLM